MSYYSTIVIFSTLALISMVTLVFENGHLNKKFKCKLYISYMVIIIAGLSEYFAIYLNGADSWTIPLHVLAKVLDYVFTPFIGYFVVLQVVDETKSKMKYLVLMIINIIIEVISIFTGWTFYVDADNYYHHGPLQWLYLIVCFVAYAMVFYEFIKYGRKFGKKASFALFTIAALVIFGILLQEVLEGEIRSAFMAQAFSAILIFVHYNEFEFIKGSEKLKKQNELVEMDALTGIYNRMGFDKAKEEYFKNNPDAPCTALMIDIDDFKLINDRYGHHIGDVALKFFANNLKNTLGEDSIVGRNGGDEFCALIKGKGAQLSFEKIRELSMLSEKFNFNDKEYHFTISIGYASCEKAEDSRNDLFGKADAALYYVKQRGKNYFIEYQPYMIKSDRTQLGFALRDVAMNVPGAILIYSADWDKEEILFANKELVHMFDCENMEEFLAFANYSFKGIVHPDDYERVEASIKAQVDKQLLEDSEKTEANVFVDYKIMTKKGKIKNIIDNGRLVDNEYYGKIFYVLLLDADMRKPYVS